MNIKEMPIEEVMKLDPHTLSISDLKDMRARLSDEQFVKMKDKAYLTAQKQLAKQTTLEHTYELPREITVAWLADDDGKSQFIGMARMLEGITTPIHVKKYTRPAEMKGLKHDLVLVDFGGVGENYGEIVFMDYCEPVRKLIEENPNTLFMLMTTWTSRWMNIYLEDELKSDMRVDDYSNVVHKKNDFGESFKPLHTTDWGFHILSWFNHKHIETRVPIHPELQHLLEK